MFSSQIRTIRKIPLLLLIFSFGCSGMEQTEKEKLRRCNCKGEYIYRSRNDFFYPIAPPVHNTRAPYPWESESNLPRITKEFFRCKGSPLNPPIVDTTDPEKPTPCSDCEGGTRHGLPVIHNRENVYPILLDLLNYLQKKTGKRVIITCGHRCPSHNTYADPAKENRTSKHQVGAEVDFYIQGMEDRPQEVAGLIMQYYQETPLYKGDKEFLEFKRQDKTDSTTPPWLNKEILLKINQKNEGRDTDNRHPHPYLTIQVRYDTKLKERVQYDWTRANKNYPRGS